MIQEDFSNKPNTYSCHYVHYRADRVSVAGGSSPREVLPSRCRHGETGFRQRVADKDRRTAIAQWRKDGLKTTCLQRSGCINGYRSMPRAMSVAGTVPRKSGCLGHVRQGEGDRNDQAHAYNPNRSSRVDRFWISCRLPVGR